MKKVLLSMAIALSLAGCQKSALNVNDDALGSLNVMTPGESLGIGFSGANAPPNLPAGCGTANVNDMKSGQTIAGSLTVWNDAENLYIAVEGDGNKKLKRVIMYAGADAGLPILCNGDADVNAYPVKVSIEQNTTAFYLRTIPIASLGGLSDVTISVKARMQEFNAYGCITWDHGTWADADQVAPGGNKSTKFTYTLQECGGDD